MTRKEELQAMKLTDFSELLRKYGIPANCKKSEAIELILKAESVKEKETPKQSRPPRNHASTKLKALRVASGIPQRELAEKVGINLGTLRHYEQGSKSFDNARINVILGTCVVLGCKLEDILESEEYLEIYKAYAKMI